MTVRDEGTFLVPLIPTLPDLLLSTSLPPKCKVPRCVISRTSTAFFLVREKHGFKEFAAPMVIEPRVAPLRRPISEII